MLPDHYSHTQDASSMHTTYVMDDTHIRPMSWMSHVPTSTHTTYVQYVMDGAITHPYSHTQRVSSTHTTDVTHNTHIGHMSWMSHVPISTRTTYVVDESCPDIDESCPTMSRHTVTCDITSSASAPDTHDICHGGVMSQHG